MAAEEREDRDMNRDPITDEPGALPSVTRASDIYQAGELLYFVLTGGNRQRFFAAQRCWAAKL